MSKTSSVQPPADYVHRGSWMIEKVEKVTEDPTATDVRGVEGADFQLTDTGDIFWSLPAGVTTKPYFVKNFDLYEVIGAKFHAIKFIGSRSGDKIVFFASQKSPNTLQLKYENEFVFHCEKVWKIEQAILEPYSLLRAYKDGLFTDMEIKADTARPFAVHNIILKSTCPQLGWDMSPAPLSGTPEVVLSAIIHFLYTECLPDTIDEDSARKVLEVAGKLPGFERLANLCQLYLHNSEVKNQIINLVDDIHICGDRLIQLFSSKNTEGSSAKENIMLEPPKFSYAVRQSIKEGAVAGMKVVMICDLFNKRKAEMSKKERHDVMEYVKTRLPIFVKQLYKFYESFKEQLTQDIKPKQSDDLARYLVPEMDKCLDMTTDMVEQGKDALEMILRRMKANEDKKLSTKDYLKFIVVNAMFRKEMAQLKLAHERMCELFQSMLWRQEGFDCLSEADKMFSVNKNIEQVVEEFPIMLQKLEALDSNVSDGSMRDWRFNFKMGTSKVMWSFDKIITHRERFKPIVARLNKLIGRDAFTDGLLQVGLLASVPTDEDDEPGTSGTVSSEASPMEVDTEETSDEIIPPLPVKRPLVSESLCVPPSASESKLARAMGELLESGVGTDMSFEVITVTDEPSSDDAITQEIERKVIKHPLIYAHCAIIASRCDWFKRALLSGMRESIDKKIEVHDTDPEMFKQFLVFLYAGQINTAEMNMDQIADMMSLSDRYEVDTLKHVCEASLKTRLNEDTVLYLLGLSDQFHAVTLRDATLAYIEKHPFITSSEVYSELPQHLQAEVKLRIEKDPKVGELDPMAQYKGEQYDSSSNSSSEGLGMKGIEESRRDSDHMLDESDQEKELECIERLKEILGPDVPRDRLVELARVADYDINRAMNYHLSSK